MNYTVDQIKEKVSTDPKWATRAISALYARQTVHEQVAQSTTIKNYAGFNGADAEILSSFAKQIEQGRTLSQKQLAIAYKKLPKYARQLLAIANESALGA